MVKKRTSQWVTHPRSAPVRARLTSEFKRDVCIGIDMIVSVSSFKFSILMELLTPNPLLSLLCTEAGQVKYNGSRLVTSLSASVKIKNKSAWKIF